MSSAFFYEQRPKFTLGLSFILLNDGNELQKKEPTQINCNGKALDKQFQ